MIRLVKQGVILPSSQLRQMVFSTGVHWAEFDEKDKKGLIKTIVHSHQEQYKWI